MCNILSNINFFQFEHTFFYNNNIFSKKETFLRVSYIRELKNKDNVGRHNSVYTDEKNHENMNFHPCIIVDSFFFQDIIHRQ